MKPSTTTLLLLATPAAAASCAKTFLQTATAYYLTSQKAGSPSSLSSLLSTTPNNFLYLENNILIPDWKRSSLLATPLVIDFSRSIHDTTQCATFTELVSATSKHPYVVHTRMLFGPDLSLSLVESVVTDAGDWLFNATGTLNLIRDEKWDPIPSGRRESRSKIQGYADAYFDRFASANVSVPWGAPCLRVEGGVAVRGEMKTDKNKNGTAEECVMVWPVGIHVPYRRYVIDEEFGAVDVFVGFPGLDRTRSDQAVADSHFFRGEAGRIKYLHTASACWTAGCGLNGTVFGRRSLGVPVDNVANKTKA
ncbi:hypothetical protein QBC47DRAFT_431434 [Echria macrotheca]|uniref:DUF8021 domain-containing protein n=1 Tax=Echria macrotheca TaxID=438768 RepID=A0AAJ0F363_9PEZI|nr:hypothetical protein QBC47DRAFT_431434 [Echria macrotheca]